MKRSPLPAGRSIWTHQIGNRISREVLSMLINLELITRNSLCYYGAAKRFKHCHGALAETSG